ncbi:MAG: helix-turn-helix transcriptional regulator [Actinomycetota bacterium]|nr:helix-turn-helix transcriptional regulator [Actinomycetota bacterium]
MGLYNLDLLAALVFDQALIKNHIISRLVLTCQDIYLIIEAVAYIYVYRLKEHRERRRLTQEELATLSGVSRPTIAALELGYRCAYPTTVRKLAKALRTKPEKLYDR